MIVVRLLSPGLGWLAPPKSIRAWEPTLSWNQLHQQPPDARYEVDSSRAIIHWLSDHAIVRLVFLLEKSNPRGDHTVVIYNKVGDLLRKCRNVFKANMRLDHGSVGPALRRHMDDPECSSVLRRISQ